MNCIGEENILKPYLEVLSKSFIDYEIKCSFLINDFPCFTLISENKKRLMVCFLPVAKKTILKSDLTISDNLTYTNVLGLSMSLKRELSDKGFSNIPIILIEARLIPTKKNYKQLAINKSYYF